jgi:ATP-dependent exoDNAse (exonuclease V) beta subunit
MNERADPLALADATARAQALDVSRSFLVRAPAGSGKTELLIQRFLALLAVVERPEAIVATTFTRKAAAEMRDRVVAALQDAAETLTPSPASEHQWVTRRLAHAALARDRKLGWRLLEQPARLRIVTIDALATALARQAPIAAGLGALPAFIDDAQALHREAARRALFNAKAEDAHWQTFLAWLDNNADTATRLIAAMLAARDRWPSALFSEDAPALRRAMEKALAHEARAAIVAVKSRMSHTLATRLIPLARSAAQTFANADAPPAHAVVVAGIAEANELPAEDAREAWCSLGDWLLTKSGAFRQLITVKEGFPPDGKALPGALQKRDFDNWLREAEGVPGLAEAWKRLRKLPPDRFDDEAWAFVAAAMHVLGDASLALVDEIGQSGQADFAEATIRALTALGNDDDPTDLLLAIDYRLSHLLIDEFQDTSRAQLALIERLTSGWSRGDGRALFVVGDPMQSIYRFRQAEVRLFLEAQARRAIGQVPVGVLELSRNFRSQRGLVEWVNGVFERVLPEVSDTTRGEAAFCPSYADPRSASDPRPTLDFASSRDAEAVQVVQRIREAQAAGLTDIAVLVRARTHAQALLVALRRAGIAFSAVELEGLQDRLATRDLISLARAIAQPADRLAWLSVLRAPWCGLALGDLLVVAEASLQSSVYEAISNRDVAARLSNDGRSRLTRVRQALTPSLEAHGRIRFSLRVRAAWLALGGPACTPSALDRAGADRVFALIAEHERGGDLPDHEAFVAMAALLFGEPDEADRGGVQVMTLHRAKGLEFDVVILPALDLATGGGDQQLLRWKVREHQRTSTLVLAPLRARAGPYAAQDPVYEWLASLDSAEEAAELGRLLYVGVTRARRRLHLTAVTSQDKKAQGWKAPANGTALERLWAAVPELPRPPEDFVDDAATAPQVPAQRELWRLPIDWRPPPFPHALPVGAVTSLEPETPVFDWANAIAAAIGTVAHRLLAQVAAEGVDAWSEARLARERERIEAELGSEGVERDLRGPAAERVTDVVGRTLADPRGRWLFDAAHVEARSEWALAGLDEGRIVHVVIDRTFVSDGHRYIVDFKTGEHLGGDPAGFLREEYARYRPQLARYARIVSALDPRPIRVALYHPLVQGGWQEHAFDARAEPRSGSGRALK